MNNNSEFIINTDSISEITLQAPVPVQCPGQEQDEQNRFGIPNKNYIQILEISLIIYTIVIIFNITVIVSKINK